MSLTELRRLERVSVCQTLREVGPGAPTLCAQWSAADVAAHVVASERGWGLPMVVGYGLRRVLPVGATLRGMESLRGFSDRQLERAKAHGWDWLLGRLEAGPPVPYRLASVAPIRLIEEWIHHEDVRLANDLARRSPTLDLNEALWQAGLLLTGFPEFLPGRAGVEIVLPDGRSHHLGDPTQVRLQGEPGELLLFLAGRTTAADVSVIGDEAAIRELHRSLAV